MHAQGKDNLSGKWGGCSPEMKTIDDVEPEIDLDDIDEDWERDQEEEKEDGKWGGKEQKFGKGEEEKEDDLIAGV